MQKLSITTNSSIICFSIICWLLLSSFSVYAENINQKVGARAGPPTISFTFNDESAELISIPEVNGLIQIKATLSEIQSTDVIFSFGFIGGSGDKLKDFSFPESVTGDITEQRSGAAITIAAGNPSQIFNIVKINDDGFKEADEGILFTMVSTDAFIEQKIITIIIVDNEKTPVIILSAPDINRNADGSFDTAINEDDGGINLKLTLAENESRSSKDIQVTYTIEQSEGVSDIQDYIDPGSANEPFLTGLLVLSAEGNEKEFTFTIFPDATPENQEIIKFTLTGAENAIIHETHNNIRITVNDDDANVGAINDTGVDNCYNDTKTPIPCDTSTGFPASDQDGSQITENDFDKLSDKGNILSSTATNATCVFDRNTNLVWQIKTDTYAFSWLNKITSVNGGDEGFEGSDGTASDICGGNTPCNTDNYANVLNRLRSENSNSIGLCNITNWRLPKLRELVSIMDFETDNGSVLIDEKYFNVARNNNPGTTPTYYWTSSPAAIFGDAAWCVYFGKIQSNHIRQCLKTESLPVRMVATCTPNPAFPDRPC